MAELLSPRVVARETEPAPAGLESVPSNITAFVGPAEWGPVNTLTTVRSWTEFRRIFGGFIAEGELAQDVYGFFLTGGVECDIVRVVHVTDVEDPATKTSAAATLNLQTAAAAPTAATLLGTGVEPFALTPGATINIDVDGGGPVAATFDATAGSRTSGNTEDFILADLQTLEISVDGNPFQTVTFLTAEFANIALAKAQEVANVINAKATGLSAADVAGAVVITSDRKGTGSSIEITGGTAAGAFAFPAGAGTGTGDVSDISAVTALEIETVVEADIPGLDVIPQIGGQVRINSLTTGPLSSLQVSSGSVQIALGLSTATVTGTSGAPVDTIQVDGRYDGTRANDFQLLIAPAKNGEVARFDLTVIEDGLVDAAEIFPNLSLTPADPRYVETIINDATTGSALITVTDLMPAVPNPRPADGTFGPLTGGDDGLAGLVDADFIGGKSLANGSTGFRVVDGSDAAMICVPRATATIHNALINYCEFTREGLLLSILDLPPNLTVDGVKTYVETTAGLVGLSTFGCAFWPRLEVANPDTGFFGTTALVEIPNSGAVAGRFSATDLSRPGGVYDYSGGSDSDGTLANIAGIADRIVLDRDARDILWDVQINPINAVVASGQITSVYLDGTKTLKEDGDFERIAKRRGVILIKASLIRGLQPFVHEENTEQLRKKIGGVVSGYLQSQLRVGAFGSNDPSEAYSVDVSAALNTAATIAAKQVNLKVGLLMKDPVDYVILEFGPIGAA